VPEDDRLERNFRTDLDQLAAVADVDLPELHDSLRHQVAAHHKFDGVSPPTMSPGIDSAFYAMNGTLCDRMQKACAVIEETAKALHDIAHLYKRADGQG
jgi:hypothetical protein